MSEELSRVEDLLENGVEEPVLPMSELEAILRGEKVKPHSRVAELLLQYNPQDILIEKRIDENGTYYASADNAAGYFKVIVDTPVIPPTVLDHLVETITQNGEYTYTPEHDGYSDALINVNVPQPQPTLITKTITENGTYKASDDNADGYSELDVDVAGGGSGDPVKIQYLAYAKFEGVDDGSTNVNKPLDVKEYSGYDDYLSYDNANNEFIVLKDFQAILVPWVVNYDSAARQRAIMGVKLNGNWIINNMVSASTGQDSYGYISNSYKTMDSGSTSSAIYEAGLDECTNGMYISLHENDVLSIQKPVDRGWAHYYLKIYKIFDSTNSTDTFMDSVVDTSDTSSHTSQIIGYSSGPSPFYDFHTAADGKIVVRRKFTKLIDGTWDVETLWFFNGYHFNDFLTDIPASLLQFALKNTDVSGKAYSDNTSATSNGWVSISTAYYNNKFACYDPSWYQNYNVDMWCVIDINNGNQQVLEWSDPYDVPVTPEPLAINYNANNLPIGSSSGTYITSNFDSPLEYDECYIGAIKDSGSFDNIPVFFKRTAGEQSIMFNLAEGVGTLTVTDTTASLSSYAGSYRDIYLRLSKAIPGQTY